MSEDPKRDKEPFIIQIQPNVLSDKDAKTFTRLFTEYIEKTGVPPLFSSEKGVAPNEPVPTRPIVIPTLSNCRDTETECTCDRDDERVLYPA
jgi:hypothetical protein